MGIVAFDVGSSTAMLKMSTMGSVFDTLNGDVAGTSGMDAHATVGSGRCDQD